MAELAGFIIVLFFVAIAVACYYTYRGARALYSNRKRWRTEIVAHRDGARVQVTRPGSYHEVVVATLAAHSSTFDEQLDEAVRKADLVAAQMNAAKEVSRAADRMGNG